MESTWINKPVFGSWHITQQIGEGSYGKVYEIQREDFGVTYKAALKIITIPRNTSELNEVASELQTDEDVTAYFRSFIVEIMHEFALMAKLKGNSNIVSYEDHQVIEHTDGIGWDILIRMELLTPLNVHFKGKTISQRDVLQLGIDLCRALELCQRYNIIHRDIKPENIFVSENGDYKLGDFGIARTAEKTTGASTRVGTTAYMAPEVYRGEKYSSNVDIYSLGLVMYRLLNGNRLPFLPAAPSPITFQDREQATMRRMNGAELPNAAGADSRLSEILRKACAAIPEKRYQTPRQLREDLEFLLHDNADSRMPYPQGSKNNSDLEIVNPVSRPETQSGASSAPPAHDEISHASEPPHRATTQPTFTDDTVLDKTIGIFDDAPHPNTMTGSGSAVYNEQKSAPEYTDNNYKRHPHNNTNGKKLKRTRRTKSNLPGETPSPDEWSFENFIPLLLCILIISFLFFLMVLPAPIVIEIYIFFAICFILFRFIKFIFKKRSQRHKDKKRK